MNEDVEEKNEAQEPKTAAMEHTYKLLVSNYVRMLRHV